MEKISLPVPFFFFLSFFSPYTALSGTTPQYGYFGAGFAS